MLFGTRFPCAALGIVHDSFCSDACSSMQEAVADSSTYLVSSAATGKQVIAMHVVVFVFPFEWNTLDYLLLVVLSQTQIE